MANTRSEARDASGPARFAFLRTERALCAWESAVVQGLQETGCELSTVLIVPTSHQEGGRMERLSERLAKGAPRSLARAPEPTSVTRLGADPADALDAIAALDLDFILAFEPADLVLPLVGDPDTLARMGIWTHAFASGDGTPTLPPGFDNIKEDRALARVSLVRLTSSGAGVPLEEEWLRVEPHSYRRTRAVLTGAAASLAPRYVSHGVPPAYGPGLPLQAIAKRGELAAIRLLGSLVWRGIGHRLQRALFRQDWNVGIIEWPIGDALTGLDARDVRWLPARAGDRFLADPFGVPLGDGKCLLLAEEFVGAQVRGRIVVATIEGARYLAPPRAVLELDQHLSYPYVFADSGDGWVFVPEASQRAEVASYRLRSESDVAEREDTLLADFRAVDPTIVEHDGRWWLFATDAEGNEDGHLHLWYGPSMRGPWTAHARNPVKCDVRSARPGGTPFTVDGVLYRPAQDDSGAYGGAVVINRIDRLTPDVFEETVVARVDPDPDGPYPAGIHTLSAVGQATLVDGKRYRFDPIAKVRRRL